MKSQEISQSIINGRKWRICFSCDQNIKNTILSC